MAFLNGTFLGYSFIQRQNNIPPKLSFTKVTLYGGQSIFDKLHIQNIALTNDQIKEINPNSQIKWGLNTILLSNFDTFTLDGGNVISLPSALVGWKIYRRDLSTNISTLIATILAGTKTYVDYEVAAYKNYQYELIPYTSDAQGSPIVTSNLYTDFFGWYLMDYDNPEVVYKFDLNLTSGELANEVNITEYETYTQKPVFAQGERDYIKGQISCIAGTINSEGNLYQPIDYLDDLRAFINSGRTKLLKSRKGHVWKVITYGMPQKMMDEVGEQPVNISFSFSEVM